MEDCFNVTRRERKKENAAIISIEGRKYPLDSFYSKHPVAFYATSAFEAALVIDTRSVQCDNLVFLAGQNEAEEARKFLKD